MGKSPRSKVFRILIVGVVAPVLAFLGWKAKLTESKKMLAQNSPAGACVEETIGPSDAQKNPNAHLFVSCGGFLE